MDQPLLFLSYASPDRDRVLPYFDWLKAEGFEPWIDCRRLLPGQSWDFEINQAIERASLIIAFLSKISISRRGYVQRELKLALDRMRDRLTDDIYLIPVLLDQIELPANLRSIHAISDDDPDSRPMILEAIRLQLKKLGHTVQEVQFQSKISWTSSIHREQWDGLPGYRFELEFLDFHSNNYPNVREASEYIRGVIGSEASGQREVKLEQEPDRFSFGCDVWSRTNDYEAHPGTPQVRGRVLTVQYAIHWYSAGAAHPNYHFMTFAFLLEPFIRISSLEFVFRSSEEALSHVQKLVREQLLTPEIEDPDSDAFRLDADWVVRGTESWSDLSAFVFAENGIDFLFAPYHVAPYACGPQFVSIPYSQLGKHMKSAFVAALGIEHLVRTP